MSEFLLGFPNKSFSPSRIPWERKQIGASLLEDGQNRLVKGNHVPGTAGLDCSGYVSAAYGFSKKLGTKSTDDWIGFKCYLPNRSAFVLKKID